MWVAYSQDIAGRAHNIGVVRSTDPDLEEHALAVMGEWQFEPDPTKVGKRLRLSIVYTPPLILERTRFV